MDEKLERTLLSKFPEIFNIKGGGCEGFFGGIDCGDGWAPLIFTLCEQIQLHVEQTGREQIVARQIKQKMGVLRCVFSDRDEYIRGVVDTVVGISFATCEQCGNKGVLARGHKGWIRVLCDPCRQANPG